MNLASVATTPGGTLQSAVGVWPVTSPVTRGFQTVLYLRFETGSAGDGLGIDTDGCEFEGVFQTLDYDALHASPIPAASLSVSKDGSALIVTLDGPREVRSVVLSPPSATVELRRADGPVQADKAADSSGFTDVNFAVLPRDKNRAAADQVIAVNVRGKPANPRVAIASPALDSPAMFWPTPDVAGQLDMVASCPIATALQAYLADQWQNAQDANTKDPPVPLPDHIDAAIVIQSDAPCQLSISKFNVRFHRLLTSFSPGDGDKHTLRYTGNRVERQSLSILLPGAATVATGTVRVNESFRPRGLSVKSDDLLTSDEISQDRGIRITAAGGQSAGQRVTPSEAVSAAGIALGIMALAEDTQLAVALESDWHGAPSGKKVSGGSVSLTDAGHKQWIVVSWKDPVTLSSEPFWVLVSATKGAAVWLAETGSDSVHLLAKEAGVWSEAAKVDGVRALYRLLPYVPVVTEVPKDTAPQPAPEVRLSIGDGVLTGELQKDGNLLFDVTAAVNTYLVAARSGAPLPGSTSVPLVFTTGNAGLITVYPPHIEYDL
jgi:hypothetical protein